MRTCVSDWPESRKECMKRIIANKMIFPVDGIGIDYKLVFEYVYNHKEWIIELGLLEYFDEKCLILYKSGNRHSCYPLIYFDNQEIFYKLMRYVR